MYYYVKLFCMETKFFEMKGKEKLGKGSSTGENPFSNFADGETAGLERQGSGSDDVLLRSKNWKWKGKAKAERRIAEMPPWVDFVPRAVCSRGPLHASVLPSSNSVVADTRRRRRRRQRALQLKATVGDLFRRQRQIRLPRRCQLRRPPLAAVTFRYSHSLPCSKFGEVGSS